ncbi:MAG: hypothetical protein ACLPND_26340 [Candidatus Korobacteraceae bacterium]|jgi:hypothetical protein
MYREHGSYGTDTMFHLPQTFKARDDAIIAAITVGKRKVDEGYDDNTPGIATWC